MICKQMLTRQSFDYRGNDISSRLKFKKKKMMLLNNIQISIRSVLERSIGLVRKSIDRNIRTMILIL
jgi:hypothetical protein